MLDSPRAFEEQLMVFSFIYLLAECLLGIPDTKEHYDALLGQGYEFIEVNVVVNASSFCPDSDQLGLDTVWLQHDNPPIFSKGTACDLTKNSYDEVFSLIPVLVMIARFYETVLCRTPNTVCLAFFNLD